ncbi:MAG: leucine--tRNA ligase [Clostridiaceae bacterium]|jgi:leucyl-tRNA synthetase|nr:leucine--tRNA ligase [Clostridiaceae bacterium]
MDYKKIEKKWQKKWKDEKAYKFDPEKVGEKKYVLEMFSYPSGAKLHVGHWYNYGPSDSYARFKRMQGYEVFHPMGFDAFGLPAENYAIKTGIHPKDSTFKNIKTMEKQLKAIGATYDWNYEVITADSKYYRWTQWIFLQLLKAGLAYRKEAPVNWCPSCQTVLANEQVKDGDCERCGSVVVRKNLTQWFFKITDYADELLAGLDGLDWPEKTKLMQKNWIGKSYGGEIEFTVLTGQSFKVFTTRADTLFGVSYVVLAPEHPLVAKLTTPDRAAAVAAYVADTGKVNEIERLSTAREKSGIFTGAYAINPINGRKVPVYIADYVLASYGTGAVMGVPSHDERDFIFAKKYGLPIERVVKSADGSADELPYVEYGVNVNSGRFDGLTTDEAKIAIVQELQKNGKGELKTNYRLRDWLVSRQRYWGAPIPIIHCPHCGAVPVPEKDLPVLLPYNVDFTPDGKSPLLKSDEFMNVKCPVCGAPAKREPDTLDTFVCSSWYFLRYPDNKNKKKAFDGDWINKMLPVDKYIGGAEHACMHLLYARFFTKALRDMGYLNFDEPFLSLVHQGLILGPDGNKMSKSLGNVVSPDETIKKYGSDAFRLYLMFGFSYIEGGPWSDKGIESVVRFMERVERLAQKAAAADLSKSDYGKEEKELNYIRNSAIKSVTRDMEAFGFNTAVARLMELTNALYAYDNRNPDIKHAVFKAAVKDLILLMAPMTPHFAEELNESLGGTVSVFKQRYPVIDESALTLDEVEIAVQINSRVKAKLNVPSALDENGVKEFALSQPQIAALVSGAEIKKIVVVPKRLINIIL